MEQTVKVTLTKPIQLLVIECTAYLNWFEIFKDVSVNGVPIHVDQAEWDDISPVVYGDSNSVVVQIRPAKRPLSGTPQDKPRTITVDFLLVRSVTRGIHNQDSRNLLYAFAHANIPSVNSVQSILMTLERPIVFGQLKSIQKKLGKKNFPLIEQNYYPTHNTMIVLPDFPAVAKVGHAHSGYGKIKLKSSEEAADFKSLAALHGDYVTIEPFVTWDFDMRIQKIGNQYRGFKRISSNWKGNVGNQSVIDDMEISPTYKQWIDECSNLFGGLDICALDLLHSKETGNDYILELNDTAIGLVHKYEHDDMINIRNVVITKMMMEFFNDKENDNRSNESMDKDETIKSLQKDISLLKTSLSLQEQETKKLEDKLQSEQKKKKGLFK